MSLTETLPPVSPNRVSRYLMLRGWKCELVGDTMQRIWLPAEEGAGEVEIFLNSKAHENARDVIFALRTISQLYDKSIEKIAYEIISLAYDKVISRIPDEYVSNETIELRIAKEYITRMKGLLTASATTEINQLRHSQRTLKAGKEFSGNCRFGHTFRGSFGFRIESPIDISSEQQADMLSDKTASPFGRRVIQRMSKGFQTLEEAASVGSTKPIIDADDGLSSNMCDSIYGLISNLGVSRLDMRFAFSKEIETEATRNNKTFSLKAVHLELLKDASKSLKEVERPRNTTLSGRITKLQTTGNPANLETDRATREAEILCLNEEEKKIKVRALLTPEQYLEAVEAHRNGHPINASGTLVKNGRQWELIEIAKFESAT